MEPASIRYKNPGAMWGNKIAVKWGADPHPVTLHDGLKQGNNIAVFPTYAQGIAAQLDLWRTSPNYRNKRFADAIAIWSGHNNVESYIHYVLARVPGMTRDTIMNDSFWNSAMGIEFLKAQAGHEAGREYPASESDWLAGQRMVFNRQPPIVAKPIEKHIVAAGTATVATYQASSTLTPWFIYLAVGLISVLVLYIIYHLLRTEKGQFMLSKIKAFVASAWDWTKRIFGRSRTIALNVFAMFSYYFLQISDSVQSLNLDDVFKHEVASGIMFVVMILNVLLRLDTKTSVSFKQLEPVDVPVVVAPVAPVAPVAAPPAA